MRAGIGRPHWDDWQPISGFAGGWTQLDTRVASIARHAARGWWCWTGRRRPCIPQDKARCSRPSGRLAGGEHFGPFGCHRPWAPSSGGRLSLPTVWVESWTHASRSANDLTLWVCSNEGADRHAPRPAESAPQRHANHGARRLVGAATAALAVRSALAGAPSTTATATHTTGPAQGAAVRAGSRLPWPQA